MIATDESISKVFQLSQLFDHNVDLNQHRHHLHLHQGFALLLGYCLIRHVSREETTLEPVV